MEPERARERLAWEPEVGLRDGLRRTRSAGRDPEALLRFYRDVFGFRELCEAHAESRKRPGYRRTCHIRRQTIRASHRREARASTCEPPPCSTPPSYPSPTTPLPPSLSG